MRVRCKCNSEQAGVIDGPVISGGNVRQRPFARGNWKGTEPNRKFNLLS